MPSKPRRKGKFSPQRRSQGGAPARPAAVQPVRPQPSAAPAAPAFKPKAVAPLSQSPATLPIPHTNVVTEMKTIAILAGVLVVILVVLSFVLR